MQITWFGHSAFRLDFKGQAVLIDPFFTGNPAFASDKAAAIKGISHILLTHGHGDHVGDTLDIAKSTGATVTANFDLGMWLGLFGYRRAIPAPVFWVALVAGIGLFSLRLSHHGWWTGHLTYSL